MDRTLSLTRLVAVALLLLLPTTASGYDFMVDGIYYNVEDGQAVVTNDGENSYNGSNCYNGVVEIPEQVTFEETTYPVVAIGENAFYNSVNMTDVIIPNSVTTIRKWAFCGCTGLTRVIIPNSVTTIGDYVFYNCNQIVSITFGSGLTMIGRTIFYAAGGKMTDMTCLAKRPPDFADHNFGFFYGSSYYPQTLHVLPESVEEYKSAIMWRNFAKILGDASENGYAFVVDGIYYDVKNGKAIVTNNGHLNCYSGNVVIPDEVTHEGITYPVVAIGDDAFKECIDLFHITISNTVTAIGNYSFYNCKSLTDITLPDSLTSIGHDAFHYCTGLTQMTIPDAVTIIGNSAFKGCVGIKSLTLGKSVATIEPFAFQYCSMTSITIPESVSSIGEYAFSGCYGMKALVFNAINYANQSISHVFDDCSLESIIFGERVPSIPAYMAKDQTQLKSVTIPNSVTVIGGYAFYGCSSLAEVVLPNSLNTIGPDAFHNCTSLTNIIIPDAVTSITSNVFQNCSALVSVVIGKSVKEIGIQAFYGCSALTSITIPNSVNLIREYAFDGCSNLASAKIGSGIASIGSLIFHNCNQLTNVTCLAIRPPDVNSYGLLDDDDDYARATLHVLPERVGAYQAAMYWQKFSQVLGDASEEDTNNIPGDVNGDGVVNVADVNSVIDIIINGGSNSGGHNHTPIRIGAVGNADLNGDGTVNIADLNAIIDYIINY